MGKVILERSNRCNSKGEDLYFMKIASGRGDNLNRYSELLSHELFRNPSRSELFEYVKKENQEWLKQSMRMALDKLIETIDYNVEEHANHVQVTAELHVLLTKEQIELLAE